jgi:tetratricopeptide (TPR) repeat protein
MKKAVVLLIIILASQMIAGQGRYKEMLRAVALSAAGNNNEAAGVLTGLINAAPDPRLLLLRGDAFLGSGKVKEAQNDFMAAESMNQGSGLYGLARCAAAGGDARAAVSYLEAHLKSQYRKSDLR